ncbi:MAG: adenine deaminase [Dehalococcoidia bacterium]|nr:Adenine deaminase [Chloroflexota bacterium]MBT9162383.1 Adenine deaminase [Chloroflexota bacterium]
MDIQNLLAIARGDAPADLLLVNAQIVNTFTARIEEAHVAICQNLIAGVGNYQQGKEIIDLRGKHLIPGFIDGHIHLESSLLSPAEYARAVVPRGVLSVVTDFHEIANVCGLAGIKYMLKYAECLPMDIFGMAPSCVPATHLETAGARLDAEELQEIMNLKNMIGLGEMMNFPGVIGGDPGVWDKLRLFRGRVIDGHAPGLRGKELNSYLSAGIFSDHECTTIDEAREKLNGGMYLMIREGSSEKNLDALLPLVTDRTFKRCLFVVDDRSCADLLRDGDVDAVVRKAITRGLDPIRAIQMATINTVEYFRLQGLGAIAPGYRANLVVLDDLADIEANMVFYDGKLVAEDGRLVMSIPTVTDVELTHTVNIKPFDVGSLRLPARGETAPVIEIIPDQIITRRIAAEVKIEDGLIQPDIARDLLKLVVVERHKATGNIGRGLVHGFGLKKGALASSVAHDSHNIIAVGTSDGDILAAIRELERLQGGLAIADGGQILGSLALPIAGLLSEEPLERVVQKLEELKGITATLGCTLAAPFATLSFLALPVIPELRLTDLGLVDVMAFKLLDSKEF